MKTSTYVAIAVSLAASNFAYQALMSHNYMAAFERSYFQTVAIFLVATVNAITSKNRGSK